jgi:hypothetical protein
MSCPNLFHQPYLTETKDAQDDVSAKGEAITSTSSKPKSHRSLSLSRTRSAKSGKSSKKHQQNIVKEVYPETDLDKGLVGWEGQDDPTHPRFVLILKVR